MKCFYSVVVLWLFSSLVMADSSTPTPLEIGAQAPSFDLPGIDGKSHSLEDYADSDVLAVLFTCNHCPTAQAYEVRINDLYSDFKGKNFEMVAISPNDNLAVRLDELGYSDLGDSLDDMKIRAEEQGFEFPYLYDGDSQVASREYGALATPHIFIFDKERKLRYQGRIDNSESGDNISSKDARNAIEALLAGKPVEVENTRAFGCSTKWSSKRGSLAEAEKAWQAKEVTVEMASATDIETLLKNETDNLLLVNLWATWCGPCVAEFPELVKISRMYELRPFEMVTISVDRPKRKEAVLKFLKSKHSAGRNLLFESEDKDELAEVLDSEWTGPIPYTLLVTPGGEIIYRHLGEIDSLELRRAIVAYLGRVY